MSRSCMTRATHLYNISFNL